jgi:hypothetical protein
MLFYISKDSVKILKTLYHIIWSMRWLDSIIFQNLERVYMLYDLSFLPATGVHDVWYLSHCAAVAVYYILLITCYLCTLYFIRYLEWVYTLEDPSSTIPSLGSQVVPDRPCCNLNHILTRSDPHIRSHFQDFRLELKHSLVM